MPNVNIREIDNTGSETPEYLDYTVFVPGVELRYKENDQDQDGVVINALMTTTELLDKKMINTTGPAGTDYENDLGYLIAYKLLEAGLSVYYYSAYTYDPEDEYNQKLVDESVSVLFSKFVDKGKYDLRFITLGGLQEFSDASDAAIKCAGDRGDAIALIGLREDDIDGKTTSEIDQFIQDTFKTRAATPISRTGLSWSSSTEVYGSYATLCDTPFAMRVNIYREGDKDGEKDIIFPGEVNYLLCFAKYINTYPEWFAFAGAVRGVSPFSIEPLTDFGDSDIDVFQDRSTEDHIASNLICNRGPYKNIIWGNRTMRPLENKNGVVQLTASSFLNIRHLCSTIKKTLYRAAVSHTFEPNSDNLWFSFINAIKPTLEEMKSNQGIFDYQLIKQKTNKKGLVVAVIQITPIEAVEDFDLTVELTDSIIVTE